MSSVTDNRAEHRFELQIEGNSSEIAAAYYLIKGDRIILTHTEVPQQLSGKGIGSQLARGVFDAIRTSSLKAVLRCPFMGAYYARHPEYSDIVADKS
ncbi:GNAT family N-acetyltransferase [Pseudomonas sp. M30-35]|uniref:GNAT family N-acetyltransferase n=1 Tax=Pseudomonas sp. M30-35 TaxID=1981174 RepID=UPI000B3BE441|nr:GNAT family N-acetyltransferase [Pseudomonas sp. M30-35]ARU88493.1 N-acetyltransferase [Pseudomonas sp. M30-35]